MDQHRTNETLKLFYSYGRKILPRHTNDNLCYVSDLTCVLAADASISFADLRCQLPDEGVQNADVGGDCEKNEDKDNFSFACTNLDGSQIYSKMARSVWCSRFSTGISCSLMPTTMIIPEPEGLPLRLPLYGSH
ncbi:unnamed protein product [Prunus brigantina]